MFKFVDREELKFDNTHSEQFVKKKDIKMKSDTINYYYA